MPKNVIRVFGNATLQPVATVHKKKARGSVVAAAGCSCGCTEHPDISLNENISTLSVPKYCFKHIFSVNL